MIPMNLLIYSIYIENKLLVVRGRMKVRDS